MKDDESFKRTEKRSLEGQSEKFLFEKFYDIMLFYPQLHQVDLQFFI